MPLKNLRHKRDELLHLKNLVSLIEHNNISNLSLINISDYPKIIKEDISYLIHKLHKINLYAKERQSTNKDNSKDDALGKLSGNDNPKNKTLEQLSKTDNSNNMTTNRLLENDNSKVKTLGPLSEVDNLKDKYLEQLLDNKCSEDEILEQIKMINILIFIKTIDSDKNSIRSIKNNS